MHRHIRFAVPSALLIVALFAVTDTEPVIAQSEVIEIRALKDEHPEITSLSTRITIRMKGRVGANNRAQNVNGQVVATYVIDNERGEKSLEFGGSLFGQLLGLGAVGILPVQPSLSGIAMYLLKDRTYAVVRLAKPLCVPAARGLREVETLEQQFTPENLIGDWTTAGTPVSIPATLLSEERINGIDTLKYRVEKETLLTLSQDSPENADSYKYAEIWLAKNGNYMVRTVIYASGSLRGAEWGVATAFAGDYQITYDVIGVNNGQRVKLPSYCVKR